MRVAIQFYDFWAEFANGKDCHLSPVPRFWEKHVARLLANRRGNEIELNFYSVFRRTNTVSPNHFGNTKINVHWSGESSHCENSEYDLSFVMEPTNLEKKRICLTLFSYFATDHALWTKMMQPRLPPTARSQRFCCFIVSNPHGTVRNRFFHLLSTRYKPVESCGNALNNVGYTAPRNDPVNNHWPYYDFLAQYRFCICFENCSKSHYLTEKLIYAWMGGCIPIYWGSSMAPHWLNPKAFLQLTDTSDESMVQLIDKIREIDLDPIQFESIRSQPLMHYVHPDLDFEKCIDMGAQLLASQEN